MCGEHQGRHHGYHRRRGSSPRVRGTPAGLSCIPSTRGIIPACAGNTSRWTTAWISTRDHPRVCGEHETTKESFSSIAGSSPRVRGTLCDRVHHGKRFGIIPACAGNTTLAMWILSWNGDHPRVCGEHAVRHHVTVTVGGSSPRVRGTPSERIGWIFWMRIIPACAGNTCAGGLGGVGEEGSSPRVRGTRVEVTSADGCAGIIPACAGNTWCPAQPRTRPRDHPRVCGEHRAGLAHRLHEAGSSPRVRGTRDGRWRLDRGTGIIPACAGNTGCCGCETVLAGDHPRVCGEHWDHSRRLRPLLGSSPRVRGTLFAVLFDLRVVGIIPACAGNTRCSFAGR